MNLIHQLSKRTGIPIHTIRYYERYGLIQGEQNPAITSNNYRWYGENIVEKLTLIKEAKEIGFSLAEIKHILNAWHGGALSKEQKKKILQGKIQDIEVRIKQLQSVKFMLQEGIQEVENDEC